MSDNHKTDMRPLIGGVAIRNAIVSQLGTLGLITTSDGADRWMLSCYHVLCRSNGTMPAGIVEDVLQPGSTFPVVAKISEQRSLQSLDCAAALILDPANTRGRILGIGRLSPPILPHHGMRVLKSGAATGVTEGVIRSILGNEVDIQPIHPFHVICQAGDSGAVWVDADTMSPVALNCQVATPGNGAIGKVLLNVLNVLGLQMVID